MTDNQILITRQEVEKLAGISRSTLYKLMSESRFPKPVRITSYAVRWYVSEVKDWIASRPRATGEIKAA